MAPSEEDEDAEDGAVPGYRNYLVYSDESGIHGANYYGFGTLWMPHERRGDFTAMIAALRLKHGYQHEMKWTKVKRDTVTFYLQLLDEFFKRNWLMFHCLIVRKGYVDMSRHADIDEARRKHFAMLVKAKVKYFCAGAVDKAYHFRIDPFPSRYPRADVVAFKIAGAQLKNELALAKSAVGAKHRKRLEASVRAVQIGGRVAYAGEAGDVKQRRRERARFDGGRLIVTHLRRFDRSDASGSDRR